MFFPSFTKGKKKELQCENATNVKHDTTSILTENGTKKEKISSEP